MPRAPAPTKRRPRSEHPCGRAHSPEGVAGALCLEGVWGCQTATDATFAEQSETWLAAGRGGKEPLFPGKVQ
eukprot:4493484-Alexandrium_andersonii.AAC.1